MRLDLGQQTVGLLVFLSLYLRTEAHTLLTGALLDDTLDTVKCTAADKQNIGRVDLNEFLMRMLASALRRYVGNRALEHFQQCLLYALTRNIAGDGRVFALAGNLVDLIDIDNAVLCQLHIKVRRLDQSQQNVLDILTDVTGLGQCGRVRDRERNLQSLGQRLCQQRLARAGRTQHQDVGLLQLYLGLRMVDALVVVVNRNRKGNLRTILTDNVLIEHLFQLLRRRQVLGLFECMALRLVLRHEVQLVIQNAGAYADTLIADIHVRSCDQLAHAALRLAAERAFQFFSIIIIRHMPPLYYEKNYNYDNAELP